MLENVSRNPGFQSDFFRSLYDKLHAVIFVCNIEGRIINCNYSCEEILGYPVSSLTQKKLMDLILEEDHDKLSELLELEMADFNLWEINFITSEQRIVILNCYKVLHQGFTVLVARGTDPQSLKLQEELMSINNEMTNLYRELGRKNQQLHDLNKILEKQRNEIEQKNKILNNQLRLARKIQEHLISKNDVKLYDLDFKFNYIPAYDIGGDYYDVVDLKNGKAGIFISDVSGHGISAALIMVIVKMLFLNQGKSYEDPQKLISELNKEFYSIFGRGFEETYCTAFYCVIDTVNMTIRYCNAGHPGPVLYKNSSPDKELEGRSFPIGFFPDSEYESNHLVLDKNDKVAFFTDGLSDFVLKYNFQNVNYGEFFNNQKNREIIDKMKDDGEIHDDISLIVVEVNKKEIMEEENHENNPV